MQENEDFENYCKLRNPKGSECGTCPCGGPKECENPPEHLLRGVRFVDIMEQKDEYGLPS